MEQQPQSTVVPPESPPRRRRSVVKWGFALLVLIGLGLFVNDLRLPRPRCTISFPSSFSLATLSPNGEVAAIRYGDTDRGGFAFLGGALPFPTVQAGLARPEELWDTRSGRLISRFPQTLINHRFARSFRYVAAWEDAEVAAGIPEAGKKQNKQANPCTLHLVNLHTSRDITLKLEATDHDDFRFSPQGSLLFVHRDVGPPSPGYLIEAETGRIVRTFNKTIDVLEFSRDDRFMLFRPEPGLTDDIELLELCRGKNLRIFQHIRAALFSPDGATLVALTEEGLTLVNLPTMRTCVIDPEIKSDVDMYLSPDGKILLLSAPDGKLAFWDLETKRRNAGLEKLAAAASDCFFSPDSRLLLFRGEASPDVTLCEAASSIRLWTKKLGASQPVGLAFTPDSRAVIRYLDRDHYDVFDSQTGEARASLSFDDLHEFTPDRGSVFLQSTVSRQPGLLQKVLGPLWPIKSNPKHLQVRVLDVASGDELAGLEGDDLREGWLSEDGRTLLTRHERDGEFTLCCWDVPLTRRDWVIAILPAVVAVLGLLTWSRARRRGNSCSRAPS